MADTGRQVAHRTCDPMAGILIEYEMPDSDGTEIC
jgi:hypothetical protein